MPRSTSPPALITALNAGPGVVPACVGPRPRNSPVGEQGQRITPHLQLRPHKQPRPHLPGLLRLAHPLRTYEGEVPRPSPHPETPSSRSARHRGLLCGRQPRLRSLLRVWYDGGCGQGAGTLLRGAVAEREHAELAGRRIGAAERGSRWGRSGPSARSNTNVFRAARSHLRWTRSYWRVRVTRRRAR